MRVSIIITTYNYAQFLAQAIDSALSQSYPDIDVVVVNDGSTDHTSEVIKPYLSQITYIDQPNSGVVTARNNDARKSTGEYLVFLDADDYLPIDFVEQLMGVLRENPAANFAYGDKEVFGIKNFRQHSKSWDLQLIQLINYIGLTSVVSRKAFDAVGGFSSTLNQIKSYEDWDFWLSMAEARHQGVYDPGVFYFYRRLDGANRNRAGVLQKLWLRWPVMRRHWKLYIRFKFWLSLPRLLFSVVINKLKVLKV